MFWGPIPSFAVLKVELLKMRSKPFISQGAAGSYEFPPDFMALCVCVCVYYDSVLVFLPILIMNFFFSCPVCRSHSASLWISFRDDYSLFSYTLGVSVEGGVLKSFLCHPFDQPPIWKVS